MSAVTRWGSQITQVWIMLERELEPEVMDDPAESRAYDAMDHAAVNVQFVSDYLAQGPATGRVLDVGTGTARIPIELCGRMPDCHVVASDAAASMLEIAAANIEQAGLSGRIQVHQGDSKALDFEDGSFDDVISNSLLHHLPEPLLAVREMFRVTRPGGRLFVRDLLRPDSLATVDSLVKEYAGQEDAMSRQLFRQSLIAALTEDEMCQMVQELGFPADTVRTTSDRHLTWLARKPEH